MKYVSTLILFALLKTTSAQQAIKPNVFYSIVGSNGLAMQTSGTANETIITQATPTGNVDQLWQFVKVEGRGYRIVSKQSPAKCISLDEAGFAVLYDFDLQVDQFFNITVVNGRGNYIVGSINRLPFACKDGDGIGASVYQYVPPPRSRLALWKCVETQNVTQQTTTSTPTQSQPPTAPVIKLGSYDISLYTQAERTAANTAVNSSFMSQEEKDFIYTMNLARVDGSKFEQCFLNNYVANAANKYMVSISGAEIASLRNELKLSLNTPLLLPYEKLSQSTAFHTNEMKDREYTINSIDGTTPMNRILRYIPNSYVGEIFTCTQATPFEAVIGLLIDRGVPDLHHRRIILNTHSFDGQPPVNWRRVGTSVRIAPTGTWFGRPSEKLYLADFGANIPGDNP